MAQTLHEASWWHAGDGKDVICDLCPHACRIALGRTSRCAVRQNRDGRLYSLAYAQPATIHVDPIEKKPLYHFLPGTHAYSVGTVGCNFRCSFCQNYSLSTAQLAAETREEAEPSVPPEQIVAGALRAGCASIALTYNEPTVWAEYGLDIARLARGKGLKTVSVTNGFIQDRAGEELYAWIDAANVDLKAFDDDFYRRLCGGRLEPVLQALKMLRRLGVWLEVTNLIIPQENDEPGELRALAHWVKAELGAETPLHFSAFYPTHQLTNRPATPRQTLFLAGRIAEEEGLVNVHLGNLHLAR